MRYLDTIDQLMRALLKFALLVTVAIWIAAVPTQGTEAVKGSATSAASPRLLNEQLAKFAL